MDLQTLTTFCNICNHLLMSLMFFFLTPFCHFFFFFSSVQHRDIKPGNILIVSTHFYAIKTSLIPCEFNLKMIFFFVYK